MKKFKVTLSISVENYPEEALSLKGCVDDEGSIVLYPSIAGADVVSFSVISTEREDG